MSMVKLSVPQAADRLGVSAARIRQRIYDGSLVAEKLGGRWVVEVDASQAAPPRRGRPVSPASVWWSLAAAAPEAAVMEVSGLERHLSRASRHRAVRRLEEAVEARDHDAVLAWLSSRASRAAYVAAVSDLASMRDDERLILSGVSHPESTFDDPRIVEAYVGEGDVDDVVSDYWLEKPTIDQKPNVVLHVAPRRPLRIDAFLLAADLAEHRGPRELGRARELLDEAMDALWSVDARTGGRRTEEASK